MPRVLILSEYPTLLGGERSMLATLPALSAAGFQFEVAAPPDGALADALIENSTPHFPWQTHDVAGQRLPLSELRAGLAAIISKVRPDLVHANSLSVARIAGPVASDSGIPSIGHLRDIIKLTTQAIDDLNRHRRLLAVSQATRSFHIAQGVDAEKCIVLNNGVDLKTFQPRQPTGYLHRELNLPANSRLIVAIGQLGLRKGTDVALAAAREVAATVPNAHWLIVGERTSKKPESREFEQRLHRIAKDPPLCGRVHFLGNRHDVATLLNECTLLLHAARQEPLGRVLLEAAASGLPVVATDVGGTREILPTENDGAVLVPPDDNSGLTDAIISLLRDNTRREVLAAGARHRAEVAFDIRLAAEGLIQNYSDVLN